MIPGKFIAPSTPLSFQGCRFIKEKSGTKMFPGEFIAPSTPLSFQGCRFPKEKRGDQNDPLRVYIAPSSLLFRDADSLKKTGNKMLPGKFIAPSTPIFSGMQIH
jgi:hypothetical protein